MNGGHDVSIFYCHPTHNHTNLPLGRLVVVMFVAWLVAWMGRGDKWKRYQGGFVVSHRLDWTGLGGGWMVVTGLLLACHGSWEQQYCFLYL
ncbi:hypothetical protein B0T18DRAFT_213859 [Schizothecium vesticola]|uniref:Uncharacterized protein n=1 Tax=Schizothecium vesticola TaxID=314040 RepID=A0AA40EJT2_9PEZI|nr:hypothetical protein B0T18DRAFT_213859 [Schizothecium vesticola]